MAHDERPVAELLQELSEQTSTLVRQEMELARLELMQKGKRAGIGAGMFGGASMVGLYAIGAFTAAVPRCRRPPRPCPSKPPKA